MAERRRAQQARARARREVLQQQAQYASLRAAANALRLKARGGVPVPVPVPVPSTGTRRGQPAGIITQDSPAGTITPSGDIQKRDDGGAALLPPPAAVSGYSAPAGDSYMQAPQAVVAAAAPAVAAAPPVAGSGVVVRQGALSWVSPPRNAPFQYQLGEVFNPMLHQLPGVKVYVIDLFDTPADIVRGMRAGGLYPVCYFSTAFENWRPDKGDFPKASLGNTMDNWEGERWVDIRSAAVRAVAKKRLELCKSKGFLGVEADNVDVTNIKTGFPITPKEQVSFIKYLADTSHSLGLAFGLKNTPLQVKELSPSVDFAINEECGQFKECSFYKTLLDAGKPVFNIEYDPPGFTAHCSTASSLGLRPILKSYDLKATPRTPCPGQP